MANWENVGKIQGEKGEKGDKGDTGEKGDSGLKVSGNSFFTLDDGTTVVYGVSKATYSSPSYVAGTVTFPVTFDDIPIISLTVNSRGRISTPSFHEINIVAIWSYTNNSVDFRVYTNGNVDFDEGDELNVHYQVIGKVT